MKTGLALKLYGSIFLVLISLVGSSGALAATAPQAPGEPGNSPSGGAFAALWQGVMDEAALTPDQTTRLAQELRTLAANLQENSSSLAALRAQEQAVPAESLPLAPATVGAERGRTGPACGSGGTHPQELPRRERNGTW